MEEEHLPPRQAADKAIRQVSGALVAIVLSLCAVFVPVAFISGITGAMYKEFALTIVIAIVISGIVRPHADPGALRHPAPATCPARAKNRFFRSFNRGFDRVRSRYLGAAGRIVARPRSWIAVFLVVVVLTAAAVPQGARRVRSLEDKGFFVLAVQLPDAASRQRTEASGDAGREDRAGGFSVMSSVTLLGLDLLTFSPADQQRHHVRAGQALERAQAASPRASTPFWGGSTPARSGSRRRSRSGSISPRFRAWAGTSGLEMNLQARTGADYRTFAGIAQKFVQDANALPEVQGATTQIRADVPQVYVTIDKDAPTRAGWGRPDLQHAPGDALHALHQRLQPGRTHLSGCRRRRKPNSARSPRISADSTSEARAATWCPSRR
jgi:multidrug efflux pump subunit AcrB